MAMAMIVLPSISLLSFQIWFSQKPRVCCFLLEEKRLHDHSPYRVDVSDIFYRSVTKSHRKTASFELFGGAGFLLMGF